MKSLDEARQDLVVALVPDLREDVLRPVADRIGLPWLKSGLVGVMNTARQTLVDRQEEIARDPRFANRAELRDPETGTLTARLKELSAHVEAIRPALEKCRHPRLETLISGGYGTSSYRVPFWRLSYYQDWKAGDEILERFGKGTTFEQVREEYLQASSAMEALAPVLREARAEYDAGVALEKEYADLGERLRTLKDMHLAHTRERVARFLMETPEALAALEADPALASLTKRFAGLRHKVEYLDAISRERLEPTEQSLLQERDRLRKEDMKLQRPKHACDTFPAAVVAHRFQGRHEKTMQNLDKVQNQSTMVYRFNDYDQGRLVSDFLWWDLMTGGLHRADYIPEVRDFRASHPDWRYRPPPSDDQAAQVIASHRTAGMRDSHDFS